MHDNAPPSSKIISICESGHFVEMWQLDDDEQRATLKQQGRDPVRIRIRAATEDDGTERKCVEERIRNGDVFQTRPVSAPEIDSLVRSRNWTVNKQD